MSDEKKQHLEFLQNSILRMNTNSFQIKSIAVTLLTALFAVYASNQKPIFIFLSLIPIIVFWLLDSFYLQQERKFRGLYNDVAGITSLNEIKDYEMAIDKYKSDNFSYRKAFLSKSILTIYLPILLLTSIIWVYVKFFNKC